MINRHTKLYVQLRPDTAGLDWLQMVQHSLDKTTATGLVPAAELHLTILHIGVVERLLITMLSHTDQLPHDILQRAEMLAQNLQTLVQASPPKFSLEPMGFAGFGETNKTAVVQFAATPQLQALHADSLKLLQQFLVNCNIDTVEQYMATDHNLRYALTLQPHVTLARNYGGSYPPSALPVVTFEPMPVVY